MTMQPFSKVSAAQTSCGGYGQFRRRWLHGSLRQASIRTPAMVEGSIIHPKKTEGIALTGDGILLEAESDALKPVDLQQNQLNSPSISLSSPSPSTPMSDHPWSAACIATTTSLLIPIGPFVSPLFSPLTPTIMTRTSWTPSCLEFYSTGYWLTEERTQRAKLSGKPRPGLLDLDFSSYPISPRFPPSAAIPSPFRKQLQEDVATTPLPSGTPLTARWPGSGFQQWH